MGTMRAVIAGVGLLGAACAQQVNSYVQVGRGQPIAVVDFDLSWRSRYEMPVAKNRGASIPVATEDRLVPVLGFLLAEADMPAGQRPVWAKPTTTEPKLCVMDVGDRLATVQKVVQQLELEKPLRARLHATLLRLPAEWARDHGLRPDEVIACDEGKVTRLARDAELSEGSIRNLPEILAAPLSPFAVAVPDHPDSPADRVLRVRGEMVPVSATEVAVRLHLVRGALPVEPTRTPDKALLQPIVRLEAGKAVMVMAVEGEVATVLVVRCVELANAPLPKPDKR